MRKKLILMGTMCMLAVVTMTGCDKKEEAEAMSADALFAYGQQLEEEAANEVTYNDTPVTGLKGETLDYYWNIDTTQFDKSKFDGSIYFYGETLNGKITSNTIKEAGIEIEEASEGQLEEAPHEDDNFNYYMILTLLKDGTEIESEILEPYLICYTENDSFYSDDALFTTRRNDFGCFGGNKDVFPSVLGVSDSSEITIDLVLEKLGNPTYVHRRTTTKLKSLDVLTYINYVYVYDDVAFYFQFSCSENLKFTCNEYFPIEQLQTKMFTGQTAIEEMDTEYSLYDWNIYEGPEMQ